MTERPVIHWFRNDLRLADNPSLTAAAAAAGNGGLILVYVLDESGRGVRPPGGASRWWLHHSLEVLAADIEQRGGHLVLRRGEPVAALLALAAETGACAIHMTRAYDPEGAAAEAELKVACARNAIELRRFGGALLFEPEAIVTRGGGPFRVFTPFWKACLEAGSPMAPIATPARLPAPKQRPRSEHLETLGLLPIAPDWAAGLRATWTPGEAGAAARLLGFLDRAADAYHDARNRPDLPGTSMLSPHLHFGEVGPRQIWRAVDMVRDSRPASAHGAVSFLREVGWREFSAHLLFHFPHMVTQPFRPEFERFPWGRDSDLSRRHLRAWQRGQTGYPIVDAGMRQLWETGYMHNRVRMIVASFLCKHLLIPWHHGERWFWDTLVDADLASNVASWQWVAGSGADAAPYFRIFNPVLQGEKFDPDARYVHRYVPELARVPAAHVHAPWVAPRDVLAAAGVRLGVDYPHPIVDHAEARAAALAAYAGLKREAEAEAERPG